MTPGAGQGGSNLAKKLMDWFYALLLALIVLPILAYFYVGAYTIGKIKTVESVEPRDVAIIFGAGLTRSGAPTTVLRDRVETGVALYFDGKVKKLLMTGDNRFVEYNEPQAMKEYALELGVPETNIVLDYAGRRTYDSCYRAKEIFQVPRAIVVTQQFHIGRALYLCDQLGLDAVGVIANNRTYLRGTLVIWNVREFLARGAAVLDIAIKPKPVLGEIEPIFTEEK